MILLLKLLVGHAFADFVFQSDSMAKAKNRHNKGLWVPPGQTPQAVWPYALSAHAATHAAAVYYVTGNEYLAISEFCLHWLIDFGKCENWYGIHFDQALHVACKLGWYVAL